MKTSWETIAIIQVRAHAGLDQVNSSKGCEK